MTPRQTYGSITNQHEDDEFVSLTASRDSFASANKKKHYWALAGFVLLVGAVALATTTFGSHPATTTTTTTTKSQRMPPNGSSSSMPTFEEEDTSTILSDLSPTDLGFRSIEREEDASPSVIWGNRTGPLPTNSWYLNLVSHKAAQSPDETTRVYTIPYIVDMAPPESMTGIRVHWPTVQASDRNIQMIDDFKNGLCLGTSSHEMVKQYRVDPRYPLSHLGVSLQWTGKSNTATIADDNDESSKKSMSTHIVRGMPYVTMQYFGGALPTLYSYNGPASGDASLLVDGTKGLQCGTIQGKEGKVVSVKGDMELHFINSDFTWGIFFSKEVRVRCVVSKGDEKTREFQLSVVSYECEEDSLDPLTVRVTLLDECTTGQSNMKNHCRGKGSLDEDGKKQYTKMIRESAAVFPTSPQLNFSYPDSAESSTAKRKANVTIDWKAATFASDTTSEKDLLMFAMPHHREALNSTKDDDDVEITQHCVPTFHGSTCLVRGGVWTLSEDLGHPMSFNAPRPPEADTIPTLASALAEDISYKLSDNTLRAASDTYFSGKVLARVGRVIAIASEMKSLADSVGSSSDSLEGVYYDIDDKSLSESAEAAASENLPSAKEIAEAVEQLKKGVQVWLSEEAEAPFVFDKSWGGLVNCGCRYVGKGAHGYCINTFPDCPALESVNEDFGNGFYNDHHYHYGYHLYAAAVVARFDPEWAEDYFDKILLYIRDFANPSAAEEYFTQFRQKDWFLGSSWASGIVSAENSPHGRNEESSSEAIAAYEAIALYGAVMVDVFCQGNEAKLQAATLVRDAGQLLTATELRATNRYWHVWSSDDHERTYPKAYKQPVVGMLYDTMASFQTWFSSFAVVSYGIQLMPFTPIAEERDDPEWAAELAPLYKDACGAAGEFCVKNGWSILQAGLYAEAGKTKGALDQALGLPPAVFDSLGGMGNSLSNTIWFIATRKSVVTKTHSS